MLVATGETMRCRRVAFGTAFDQLHCWTEFPNQAPPIVNRSSRASLLIHLSLTLALLFAGRTLVEQRKTIEELQAAGKHPPAGPGSEPALEPHLEFRTPARAKALAASDTGETGAVPPDERPGTGNATTTATEALDLLRRENQHLTEQLRRLSEERLVSGAREVPATPPDVSPSEAYVGPGVWIQPNAQAIGITRITLALTGADHGERQMTAAAWGRCNPTDCGWGETPFLLLKADPSMPKARQGFALWEQEGWTRCLIVTFEPTGLKAECISLAKQPLIRHRIETEHLTRIH